MTAKRLAVESYVCRIIGNEPFGDAEPSTKVGAAYQLPRPQISAGIRLGDDVRLGLADKESAFHAGESSVRFSLPEVKE